MCTQMSQDLVDAVLADFIAQKRAFTAFEVSLEVKSRGGTERHRDMKHYIHSCKVITDEKEFGDYEQTSVPVGFDQGQQLQAFLYHPRSYDSTTYQPLPRKGSGQSTMPAVATVVNNQPTPVSVQSEAFILDCRNRLMIPTRYFRDCGLTAGTTVYIYNENGMVITDKDPGQGSKFKVMRLEPNGDLRVSQTTLEEMGLTTKEFSIDVVNNKVQVKAAD